MTTAILHHCAVHVSDVCKMIHYDRRLTFSFEQPASASIAGATRVCTPASCNICRTAKWSARGFSVKTKKTAAHTEDVENVQPEQEQKLQSQAPNIIAREHLASSAAEAGLSQRQTQRLADSLRRKSGGQLMVSPGLKDHITRHNKIFSPWTTSQSNILDRGELQCGIHP